MSKKSLNIVAIGKGAGENLPIGAEKIVIFEVAGEEFFRADFSGNVVQVYIRGYNIEYLEHPETEMLTVLEDFISAQKNIDINFKVARVLAAMRTRDRSVN